jgi:hypothetical protein
MISRPRFFSHKHLSVALCLLMAFAPFAPISAQDPVTGAFQGQVTDIKTRSPIANASVRFINQVTKIPLVKRTGSDGQFYVGLMQPGWYTIEVSASGYKPLAFEQRLVATRQNTVQPLPVQLEPAVVAPTPETPPPTPPPTPGPTPAPTPIKPITDRVDIVGEISATDGRRGGAFTEEEVTTLPLGGSTFTRSFDELALLLPGVALPPQTQGGIAGPGVGSGVGSSGQFAVNGLRSRANNFTVDGSDNNDEDIGVRRQGFFTLVPQSIESVKEYQITTLLAPAQFGRNLSAQVNAISRSGGDRIHGMVYGLLNTSHLNARDVFDETTGDRTTPLTVGNKPVLRCAAVADCFNRVGTPISTRLNTGGKDSLTLGQGGFVVGGPMPRFGEGPPLSLKNTFYFLSAEGQSLNANRQANFAVPTVEQRGAFKSGATAIFNNPITLPGQNSRVAAYPTSELGDVIFSNFPFANNPNGVYGANTFTQVLPVSAQGEIVSGKVDSNFSAWQRQHSFVIRYNFTNDERNIPVTGDSLFSGVRARVRTQNISTFLNSDLTAADSTKPFFNQLRLSYGRTRLLFEEGRDVKCGSGNVSSDVDPGCALPFSAPGNRLKPIQDEQFFLNRPYLVNFTLPDNFGVANSGPVLYKRGLGTTINTDQFPSFGPVGQLIVAGFSPVGVDVFNFPQRRVNNTYQIADTVTGKIFDHNLAFGLDFRRSELNSALPRNSRPLITFYGAPRLVGTRFANNFPVAFRFANLTDPVPFLRPEDFAAAGAPSGTFMSLANVSSPALAASSDSVIHLRYYQFNIFGQDEWSVRPNFTLSYGLRYEYNTVPQDAERRIENSFNNSLISGSLPGLSRFIDGRPVIYDSDRNNVAPRVSFAYSPDLFGPQRPTVIRGGYGLFYDQILGAVVSQSRNVFPNFLTVNLGGGPSPFTFTCVNADGVVIDCSQPGAFVVSGGYTLFNPILTSVRLAGSTVFQPIVTPLPGRPNALNPDIPTDRLITLINSFFPNPFGATLPTRALPTPLAHQYQMSFEQQINANFAISLSYVGTQGRSLLRFTTPNLGQNYILGPAGFVAPENSAGISTFGLNPRFFGATLSPGSRLSADGSLTGGRPINGVGAINQFETTAESRYDALQVQLRGRFLSAAMQYQVSYTFSKAIDDVSDVFDLAGAPALPQNSLRLDERGLANFDTRNRLSYSLTYRLPEYARSNSAARFLLNGLEFASTGQFQTGQPFTVNSLFDVNLDGNLTDRLNTTAGITRTGQRRQPLRVTGDTTAFLAAPGEDGKVGRNSFRGPYFLLANLAVIKDFSINEQQRVTFRAEFFNFSNFANYGIPVRYLEAPAFGQATETVTPGRRIQFALKYAF